MTVQHVGERKIVAVQCATRSSHKDWLVFHPKVLLRFGEMHRWVLLWVLHRWLLLQNWTQNQKLDKETRVR